MSEMEGVGVGMFLTTNLDLVTVINRLAELRLWKLTNVLIINIEKN